MKTLNSLLFLALVTIGLSAQAQVTFRNTYSPSAAIRARQAVVEAYMQSQLEDKKSILHMQFLKIDPEFENPDNYGGGEIFALQAIETGVSDTNYGLMTYTVAIRSTWNHGGHGNDGETTTFFNCTMRISPNDQGDSTSIRCQH